MLKYISNIEVVPSVFRGTWAPTDKELSFLGITLESLNILRSLSLQGKGNKYALMGLLLGDIIKLFISPKDSSGGGGGNTAASGAANLDNALAINLVAGLHTVTPAINEVSTNVDLNNQGAIPAGADLTATNLAANTAANTAANLNVTPSQTGGNTNVTPNGNSTANIADNFWTTGTLGNNIKEVADNIKTEPIKVDTGVNPIDEKAGAIDTSTFSATPPPSKTQLAGNIAGYAGMAIDLASSFLVDKSQYGEDDSFVNGTGRQVYDTIANTAAMFFPVGTVIGGAMKLGAFANDVLGKKTLDFKIDLDTLLTVGGSYGGSSALISKAASKANKKYSLFANNSRKKANAVINEARRQLNLMADISKNTQDMNAASSIMSDFNNMSYLYQMNGGYDLRYMRAAKGAKIEYFKTPFEINLSEPESPFEIVLSEMPALFKKGGTLLNVLDKEYTYEIVLTDITEDIEQFKKGGAVKEREIEVIEVDTNQKSVIPEGALHKNKHHLDQVGIDDSELTKKGIPVVDNDGDLQAEIELNEIIFTLEVTKELEKRYKEYYEEETSNSRKEELALEAGRLLWKEILYNTDDRTNLIDSLKKGGTLKSNDNQESFEEWYKKVPESKNNIEHYNLKRVWELSKEDPEIAKELEEFINNPEVHLRTVYHDEWMKSPKHPTTWMEEAWYNGYNIILKHGKDEESESPNDYYLEPLEGEELENWKQFREEYELYKPEDGSNWKYIKKVERHLNGGTISQDLLDKLVKQALINLLTK